MSETSPEISYQLGTIVAKLDSIATDTREIQDAVKITGAKVDDLDTRVTSIEAERKVMVEQYRTFKHDTLDRAQADIAWKSRQEGREDGVRLTLTLGKAIMAALVPLVGYLTYHAVHSENATPKPTVAAIAENAPK